MSNRPQVSGIVRLMNGSTVYAWILKYAWIEQERAFYGTTTTGETYYFWDVEKEGFCDNFRRAQ